MAQRLEQSPLGVRFEIEDDFLAITMTGALTDEEAAKSKVTQQLHQQVKNKAQDLTNKVSRLANQPEWQALAGAASRFDQLVSTDIESVAERVGLVWGELVSLGSSAEQDDALKKIPDAFASPLDPDIRRPLLDLLQTAGPWIRSFPTARKLDDEHAAFTAPKTSLEPAKDVLNVAKDKDVVANDDAEILDAALDAGRNSGQQSQKAGNWGQTSIRNLVVGVVAIAATGVSTGAFRAIGEEFANNSVLARKTTELLLDGEDAIIKFVESLPADLRSIVNALLKVLKNEAP
jgi:hypothetical protein